MCGIVGLLGAGAQSEAALNVTASRMADALRHRGPDDAGTWTDAEVGVAIGHRRLAIMDLSPAGHQPMVSSTGRYVIVFNGEIYNHLELRKELPEGVWKGLSDTETLLAGVEVWGLEETLQRCVGMFAIALWDSQECTLQLARDRFGEKPLFYGWIGQGSERAFAFASELKALKAYPGFANPVSREALAQYLRFTYVPAPLSIYEEIYKLEPGCLLTMVAPSTGFQVKRWWTMAEVVQVGLNNPLSDETDAVQVLEERLAGAVRLQSLADVPLGAFLSGGVDSSTIVALMQQQSTRPVRTFTVGFEEAGFDESPHARAVARHLGTDHTEFFVTAAEAQAVIPRLPQIYDEPFADSSQIPTFLVSQAASQQVTVALSGDAGDELFGGYNRYFWAPRIWNRLAWLPFIVRRRLGGALQALPPAAWDSVSRLVNVARLGDKAHKLAARLGSVRDLDDLYWSLLSEWPEIGTIPDIVLLEGLEPVERMMFRDTMLYLPDDILCKVDRAAMAVSLETRVPFLDHRIVELAWQLPLHMKIRGGQGKWALRQILYKYVPRELIERPKAGFGIPVGQWLRGPLRDWAEALLDAHRLQAGGYLPVTQVRQAWHEHLSGRRDWTARLWCVLMFQAWLEENA